MFVRYSNTAHKSGTLTTNIWLKISNLCREDLPNLFQQFETANISSISKFSDSQLSNGDALFWIYALCTKFYMDLLKPIFWIALNSVSITLHVVMLSKYGQTCAKSTPQKFSFVNRVIKIWNSLPEEIVSAGTFSRFKSLLSHADLSRFLIVVDWASRNSMICAVFHFCCFFFVSPGFRFSLVIVFLFVLVILEALLKCPLTKFLEINKK